MKHNNFNEIEATLLRTYNRAVMTTNLLEQYNQEEAEQYLNQFTDNDKAAIHAILLAIRLYGVDAVERKVILDAQAAD
ncbi:hypothetical protein [Citrobacter phage CVT22]|uniref:Uncharacterized protein n=1 Tax=Citrobacter phage CVT22 TaxID=1622234 RepID=A0A0R6CN23_9CAUD|nr:hypothetical protein APL39_gp33 [Citrobacter phage CVT22]AJT60737.1 hypothetical protein [Citrobacter phage CVT22]